MSPKEIEDLVVGTLRQRCGVKGDITPESRLQEELCLDSMGMLALAVSLENQLRVKMKDDPKSPPRRVEDVVRLVAQALEADANE